MVVTVVVVIVVDVVLVVLPLEQVATVPYALQAGSVHVILRAA